MLDDVILGSGTASRIYFIRKCAVLQKYQISKNFQKLMNKG